MNAQEFIKQIGEIYKKKVAGKFKMPANLLEEANSPNAGKQFRIYLDTPVFNELIADSPIRHFFDYNKMPAHSNTFKKDYRYIQMDRVLDETKESDQMQKKILRDFETYCDTWLQQKVFLQTQEFSRKLNETYEQKRIELTGLVSLPKEELVHGEESVKDGKHFRVYLDKLPPSVITSVNIVLDANQAHSNTYNRDYKKLKIENLDEKKLIQSIDTFKNNFDELRKERLNISQNATPNDLAKKISSIYSYTIEAAEYKDAHNVFDHTEGKNSSGCNEDHYRLYFDKHNPLHQLIYKHFKDYCAPDLFISSSVQRFKKSANQTDSELSTFADLLNVKLSDVQMMAKLHEDRPPNYYAVLDSKLANACQTQAGRDQFSAHLKAFQADCQQWLIAEEKKQAIVKDIEGSVKIIKSYAKAIDLSFKVVPDLNKPQIVIRASLNTDEGFKRLQSKASELKADEITQALNDREPGLTEISLPYTQNICESLKDVLNGLQQDVAQEARKNLGAHRDPVGQDNQLSHFNWKR